MAKLYYKFGTMGSSKSAQALMTRFNYQEKSKKVWLIKPAIDVRDDYIDENGNSVTIIKSRIGLYAYAQPINPEQNLVEEVNNRLKKEVIDVIICDECQFLTREQVNQLKYIVDNLDIPVLCFGLRADFQTNLFPGSKRLFEIADSIAEIKSICRCGRKATVNARFDEDGKIITSGNQVCLGGNDKYEGMCYKCYSELINNQSN